MKKISNRFCNYSSINNIQEYEYKYKNLLHYYKVLEKYKNILNIDPMYIKIMKDITDNKYIYIDVIFSDLSKVEHTPEKKELIKYLRNKIRVKSIYFNK
jgi:hypothetical protein